MGLNAHSGLLRPILDRQGPVDAPSPEPRAPNNEEEATSSCSKVSKLVFQPGPGDPADIYRVTPCQIDT
jgi:hypothetical protein